MPSDGMKPKYKVGTWLRWQQAGALVIGVVVYVRELDRHPYGFEYVTDNGTVREPLVLEAR